MFEESQGLQVTQRHASGKPINGRDLLPAWHRALLPDARSFIVLPLVVQKKQLGQFYADRALATS